MRILLSSTAMPNLELFSVVEESGKTLLMELKTALGPTVSNLVPYNLQQVVESHNSCLYMSLTKVLVFLDCVRWEGCDFLEDQVKSLQQQGDPPKEHQDLLESLAVKDVPKSTDPKDIYQKFLNMLGGAAWCPRSRFHSGAREPNS